MNLKILNASWHRNGVGGQGFYAILFQYLDEKEQPVMIASLFDEPGYCAVYSVRLLSEGNIAFARGNSWRGDHFEAALRPALEKWMENNGTGRMGPFSAIPADVIQEEISKKL